MPTSPAVQGARTVANTRQEDRSGTVTHARFWLLFLLGAILFLSLISVAAGSVSIPTAEVVRILLGRGSSRVAWRTIVVQLRLPRTITALAAGAALGASRLETQTLFRNPLADPFILDGSSYASL